MIEEVKKSAFEWEAELSKDSDMFIWDPDGFRGKDGVRMSTPIVYSDYRWRKMICTLGPYRRGMWDGRYDD